MSLTPWQIPNREALEDRVLIFYERYNDMSGLHLMLGQKQGSGSSHRGVHINKGSQCSVPTPCHDLGSGWIEHFNGVMPDSLRGVQVKVNLINKHDNHRQFLPESSKRVFPAETVAWCNISHYKLASEEEEAKTVYQSRTFSKPEGGIHRGVKRFMAQILADNACYDGVKATCKLVGDFQNLYEVIIRLREAPDYSNWLNDKGYVFEWEEEEVMYKPGDKFIIFGDIYVLVIFMSLPLLWVDFS